MNVRSLRPLPVQLTALAVLAVLVATLACAGAAPPTPDAAPGPAGVVYLVRHGETVWEGADRHLSDRGRARAEAIALRLADAGIERILSTETPRTEETAAPTAARLGIVVESYEGNPHERLAPFAAALRAAGGIVLVVGHSDTTPVLVELLGGEPGTPIGHDEHDRLYRVELPSGATTMERVGPE